MSECDSVKKSDQLQVDTSGAGAGPHVMPFQLLDLCGGETHERPRAYDKWGPPEHAHTIMSMTFRPPIGWLMPTGSAPH